MIHWTIYWRWTENDLRFGICFEICKLNEMVAYSFR